MPPARAALAIIGVTVLLGGAWRVASRVLVPMAELIAGASLMDGGDTAGGLRHLRNAAATRPDFAVVQNAIGHALVGLDSLPQALGPLREAVRLDSTDGDYANDLGIAYSRLHDWDSAIVAFARTARLEPTSPRGYFNGGLALLNTHQPVKAIEWFRSAVALEPDNMRSRLFLAEASLAAGVLQPAVVTLDTVLSRQPDDAIAHYYRGAAYERLGDFTHARLDMEAAARTLDTSPEARGYAMDARRELERLIYKARKPERVDRNPEPFVADLESAPRTFHCPDLVYPTAKRGTGAVGVVTLDFVVDSAGLVDAKSVEVFYADDQAFSDAVVMMVWQCSYVPARKNGRTVGSRVRQSWRVAESRGVRSP